MNLEKVFDFNTGVKDYRVTLMVDGDLHLHLS